MRRWDRTRAVVGGVALLALASTACSSTADDGGDGATTATTDPVGIAMTSLRENLADDGIGGTDGGTGMLVTTNGFTVDATPPAPTLVVGTSDADGYEAFGDADEGIDLPLDGTAMIGSQTKTFTAALVLQLDQEGVLSIDDTLADPRWADVVDWPNGEAITVEMVLAHTSGIPEFASTPAFQQGMSDPSWSPTPEQMLAPAKDVDPTFAPGEGWSYSNSNYLILGLIIEAATDSTYDAELGSRLLDPLGLDDTSLFTTDSAMPTMPGFVLWCPEDDDSSDGQGGDDEGPPPCPTDAEWQPIAPPDDHIWPLIWAAGGMLSTPEDLTTWFTRLATSDAVRDAEHRQLMQTASPQSAAGIAEQFPFMAESFVGYGLGLCLFDYDVGSGVGHLGNTPGYASSSVYFSDGWVMTIVAGENDADVAQDGANAIATAITDEWG